MSMILDVAIVGGGITGLAAAYELSKTGGIQFKLFEAADRLGGIIRTDRVDGFVIEAGPDSILATKPAGLALCHELGLDDRLVTMRVPRTAFILRHGALHPLPEPAVLGIPSTFAALRRSTLFSPVGKLRLALERLVPVRRSRDDESIASFIGRRFGDEAITCIADPLLAGIHMGDASALSVQALFPRLAETEAAHGSLLKRFASEHTAADPLGPFRSLRSGMEELVVRLTGTLPAGSLETGARLVAIENGAAYRLKFEGHEDVAARSIILAVPAQVAGAVLRPVDDDAAAIARLTSYASSVAVNLAYPAAAVRHPLAGSGFIVSRDEPGIGITAATWSSSKWPERAPEGHVLLRAFLGGMRDPRAVSRSEDDLVRQAHGDLSTILGITGAPLLRRVYRWRESSPQYDVGHLVRMRELDARLQRLGRIQVAGSAFHGTGIADCIADGRAAARQAMQRADAGA